LRENGLQEKRATKAKLSSLLLGSDERLAGAIAKLVKRLTRVRTRHTHC
jgi:hypothetical protein